MNFFIRAGMSPLDNFNADHVLLNNSIGTNSGNMLYAYSIFRGLTVNEDTTITPTYNKFNFSDKEAAEINEKYDAFIIPLADAFRHDFVNEMRGLTKLIKRLTIPCVITGVGLRAKFEPDLSQSFPFDKTVHDFISAVLEKSAMVGVRGEITSAYLTKLGFRENIDHTVIGCPSLYTYGNDFKIRDTNITDESMVCVNSSIACPDNPHDFIARSAEKFPNHYFIGQVTKELRLCHLGIPYFEDPNKNYFCREITDNIYKDNRVRFFVNVPSWYDFMSKSDFCFGTRFHGNIAATMAGTPSIFLAHDARTRELADYHGMSYVSISDLNENTDIFDLINKADFKMIEKKHNDNFNHYVDFLNKNNLKHIYDSGAVKGTAPFDKMLSEIGYCPPVETIMNCSHEEYARRMREYYPSIDRNYTRLSNEVKKLRAEKKKITHINNNFKEKINTKNELKENPLKNRIKSLFKK